MNKYYILILFLLLPFFSLAQKNNELLDWAATATQEKDYQAACYYYQEYIKQSDSLKTYVYSLYSNALRLSYLYVEAEEMFEKSIRLDKKNEFPENYFLLALTKKNLAKYEEAIELLKKYKNFQLKDNSLYAKRLSIEMEACLKAKDIINDTLAVFIEQLESKINTPYSEFNAIQLSDTAIYYSAIHPITTNHNVRVIENFYLSMIYMSYFEVSGFSAPKPISKKINNSKYHNANFCFNKNKDKLYFSRTQNHKKTSIWVSELKKHKWQTPKQLPAPVNVKEYNNTQPHIVRIDEDTDILYFVSDRLGGMGEMDIWYVIIHKGQFGEAINLGSNINTPGNEITPFYYPPTQTLYFSSDWHQGLGGYDIFKAKGAMSAWQNPENLGFPFNSPANDIYFTINEVDTDGYFSSNRKEAYSITNATCCNDIFSYEWIKKEKKYQIDTIFAKDTLSIPFLLTEILPINLYFHNDEPNPKTMDTTTQKNYKQTLDEYVVLQNLYRNEYAMGLDESEKEKAIAQIDDFFNSYVLKGYDLLEKFTSLLLKDLENGKSVNITVSGFASPLFSDAYNRNLSLRRIESLRNYLKEYQHGVFIPYMNKSNKNQLHIINVPKGKTMAKEYVSDNPNDKRNSIYSMAAALERRIQIVGYEEDTLYKNHEIAFAYPDTVLNFYPTSDITHYVKYIQIKNLDKDTVKIEGIFTDSKQIELQTENNILAPNTSTFIKISFTERVFRHTSSPLLHIHLKTSTKTKELTLKCVFNN
ncbi:MAG: hypothetical protein GX330_08545 [Bacteroidales bacterium]|nr:hypothetical protein [Bacteroidales bacterium]